LLAVDDAGLGAVIEVEDVVVDPLDVELAGGDTPICAPTIRTRITNAIAR